jgi:hypothetical protein
MEVKCGTANATSILALAQYQILLGTIFLVFILENAFNERGIIAVIQQRAFQTYAVSTQLCQSQYLLLRARKF